LELKMNSSIISRFAVVTGLVAGSALGLTTVARAGEGGIAGSAAFTIDGGNVIGVAVSAAVGKENASAAAFNYEAGSGVQNSAWSLGSAGIQDFTSVGDTSGLEVTTTEDSARVTGQANTFSANAFKVKIGTSSGAIVVDQ
jgi:hypothetical protein